MAFILSIPCIITIIYLFLWAHLCLVTYLSFLWAYLCLSDLSTWFSTFLYICFIFLYLHTIYSSLFKRMAMGDESTFLSSALNSSFSLAHPFSILTSLMSLYSLLIFVSFTLYVLVSIKIGQRWLRRYNSDFSMHTDFKHTWFFAL